MAGWTKMPLGMDAGFGPGDFVFDMDPTPPHKKGNSPIQFLAHVDCGQTAGCTKTAFGTEVDLGPGHIVLDWDPAPPCPRRKGHSSPLLWPWSPISAAELLYGTKHENKSSAVAEMGDRLATIDMGRRGAALSLSVGELGTHLTQCLLGCSLPPCQVVS